VGGPETTKYLAGSCLRGGQKGGKGFKGEGEGKESRSWVNCKILTRRAGRRNIGDATENEADSKGLLTRSQKKGETKTSVSGAKRPSTKMEEEKEK